MRVLFSKPGNSVRLVDEEKMILVFDDGTFYDIHGNLISAEEEFSKPVNHSLNDPWQEKWIEYQGTSEKLISESTIEPVCEVDDIFGNYGFKNRTGKFVIEPQYAFAYEFTCGLAAVNLNRTWYTTKDGDRYYENHFGYINEHGKTVIPFAYDEAWPFNKYGVAVVETVEDIFLIDTKGAVVPGTEALRFEHHYDYEDRFLEFTYKSSGRYIEDAPVGIYDTKERKILMDPAVESITEWSEEVIQVEEIDGEYDVSDFGEYYINSKGQILYPWLYDKGFSKVERPNASSVAIVAASCNSKPDKELYGIYSPRDFLVVPIEFDRITEVSTNVFACFKNGICTLTQLYENDY